MSINKKLLELVNIPLMSFDIETKGLYSKEERKEAAKLLASGELSLEQHKLASVVANNNGLSFPSLTTTTHFIFGLSKDYSVILIPNSQYFEQVIWNRIKNYQGKLIIHNAGFDLKVMYHRIGELVQDFEDTSIMAKCLINNADSWRAKVGLKELMGSHYSPSWSLYDEYEPEDPADPKFLEYAAIDGAATYFLYELIMENM